MRIASGVLVWIVITSFLFTLLIGLAKACTCMMQHPQEHYCSADYVALVKIKQRAKIEKYAAAYHIKIKKEFKMTEKARHALSQGLIWTPIPDSLCGIQFKSTRYLIAGRLVGEKPMINMCHLSLEWSTVTPKQKKGFRRLYQQGCHCKVKNTMYLRHISNQSTPNKFQCPWDTVSFGNLDCQRLHSFCAPSPHHKNQCIWVKSRAYRHCMKERGNQREREP
uniref:Tissue inhibitor of metalloproteases n=1 Tax=Hadrurus spadix TaxID=141984 RepID=A0A1W7RA53_9SCOR